VECRALRDNLHIVKAATGQQLRYEGFLSLIQLGQKRRPRGFICRTDLENEDFIYAGGERAQELLGGGDAKAANDMVQHRQAEYGIELRQRANCIGRHEGPDRCGSRHAVVQPRQLPDEHPVGRLDADGEAIVFGCRAPDKAAFSAADIKDVPHVVSPQHPGHGLPAHFSVPGIGESSAADLDRLVSPARLRRVEGAADQGQSEPPTKAAQDTP